jgi:glyoxylase-like metal-dependent hydrolase (beta-lactamase superfamily II)
LRAFGPLQIQRPIPSRTVSTAYVIVAGEDIVVIDTGLPGNEARILQAIAEYASERIHLRAILVTHVHPDHTGSLLGLAKATGAPVYAHDLDSPLIEVGIGGRPATPKPAMLSRILYHFIVTRGPKAMPPCSITHRLHGGEQLAHCGGIEVVHLPGHSAGHIGFLFATTGDMFAGDAVNNIGRLGRSHWHEDLTAETASLRKLAELRWTRLYIGHGAMVMRSAFDSFRKEGLG